MRVVLLGPLDYRRQVEIYAVYFTTRLRKPNLTYRPARPCLLWFTPGVSDHELSGVSSRPATSFTRPIARSIGNRIRCRRWNSERSWYSRRHVPASRFPAVFHDSYWPRTPTLKLADPTFSYRNYYFSPARCRYSIVNMIFSLSLLIMYSRKFWEFQVSSCVSIILYTNSDNRYSAISVSNFSATDAGYAEIADGAAPRCVFGSRPRNVQSPDWNELSGEWRLTPGAGPRRWDMGVLVTLPLYELWPL